MSVELSSMLDLFAGGDVDAALDRLAGDGDPMLARVVSLVRQQRAQAVGGPALQPDDEADLLARRLRSVQEQLDSALDEMQALRRRNRRLAYALGACECFGENPNCDVCAGEGASGAYRIHARLFHMMVAPALEQVQGRGGPSMPKKEESQ